MNFIDKAFEDHLQGDDFLQAMADIYSEFEIREVLDQYPPFVKEVILIIDYDTELQMDGLDSVMHGSLGDQLHEILQALDRCGATQEANVLREASAMNTKEYEENYDAICDKLAINNDYDEFWNFVRNYINISLQR